MSVSEAARRVEELGMLRRDRADHSMRIIGHVRDSLGRDLPDDLKAFYREHIESVGEFSTIAPIWNDRVGWAPLAVEITCLLSVGAVPIFFDGCGSVYGLDLTSGEQTPAVYFFDHEDQFSRPRWAAGSSLGAFLLLLADHDRAYRENWPPDWPLSIDPEIDKCPRAPPIWLAG